MPSGAPNCVTPKLDKVDLPHLENDVQKYNKAGVFEDEDYRWWLQFLESFMATYGQLPAEAPTWPLDVLPKVSNLSIPTPQPPARATDLVEQLRSIEKETPPQVLLHVCEIAILV